MLYAFIVIVVVILVGVIYFTFLRAKNKSKDFYMNMLLLKRYNVLVNKYFKQAKIEGKETFLLLQKEKIDFDEKALLQNIETIQKVEKNFYLLKKSIDKKDFSKELVKGLEQLAPLWLCAEDFVLNENNNSIVKKLNLANSIKKTRLSEEISKCFGNAVVYQLDDYILPLKDKAVVIDEKDIFEIKLLTYKQFDIQIKFKDSHEVLYDGNDPLEELDFRQEELSHEEGKDPQIETYVKCYVYDFQAKYFDKTFQTKFHIMNVNDKEMLDSLIAKK